MGHEVSAPAVALAPEVQGPSEHELRPEAAKSAWDAARASSTDPVVALRAVVAVVAHPLKTETELERAARLAEALGNGFDQANGARSISDKEAALRLADAAVKAVVELRTCNDTEVNLPFLATGPNGPAHLSHTGLQA